MRLCTTPWALRQRLGQPVSAGTARKGSRGRRGGAARATSVTPARTARSRRSVEGRPAGAARSNSARRAPAEGAPARDRFVLSLSLSQIPSLPSPSQQLHASATPAQAAAPQPARPKADNNHAAAPADSVPLLPGDLLRRMMTTASSRDDDKYERRKPPWIRSLGRHGPGVVVMSSKEVWALN